MKSQNLGCFLFIAIAIIAMFLAYIIPKYNQKKEDEKNKLWIKEHVNNTIDSDTTQNKTKINREFYSTSDFVKLIEERSDVKKAVFAPSTGIVAIIIVDNGSDYTKMAKLYCRMAVSYTVGGVKGIKIIDSVGASYGNDWADGTVLAKEYVD
jgi:uncharacterized ion transporter superfamily protein YfcC